MDTALPTLAMPLDQPKNHKHDQSAKQIRQHRFEQLEDQPDPDRDC